MSTYTTPTAHSDLSVMRGRATVAVDCSSALPDAGTMLALRRLPSVTVGVGGNHESFDVVDGWLEQPCVTVVHPTARHAAVLRGLLTPLGAAGNLTSDAHLAALSIEHGAELCSTDVDFSRFSGVRWIDPL